MKKAKGTGNRRDTRCLGWRAWNLVDYNNSFNMEIDILRSASGLESSDDHNGGFWAVRIVWLIPRVQFGDGLVLPGNNRTLQMVSKKKMFRLRSQGKLDHGKLIIFRLLLLIYQMRPFQNYFSFFASTLHKCQKSYTC